MKQKNFRHVLLKKMLQEVWSILEALSIGVWFGLVWVLCPPCHFKSEEGLGDMNSGIQQYECNAAMENLHALLLFNFQSYSKRKTSI